MPYVFSTSTASISFVQYGKPPSDNTPPPELRRVTIAGGANLPDKHLHTPAGVATRVSDDDLAFLMSNDKFQKAVRDGFMQVEQQKYNLDSVVNDMNPKDKSAPKVPGDFEGEIKKVTRDFA